MSFGRWEELLRRRFKVIAVERSTNALTVSIERSDGSVVGVEVDGRLVSSLGMSEPDIEEFLSDKLDTALLRDQHSDTERLGVIDGWVGFYDPSQNYDVGDSQPPGGFYWTATPPDDRTD